MDNTKGKKLSIEELEEITGGFSLGNIDWGNPPVVMYYGIKYPEPIEVLKPGTLVSLYAVQPPKDLY
ncbi:bacteriocin-like protein [Orenia metallireducens]|uniref:Bacteriocin-type signal sequence-containing protein n=1 Tax=Orenia metallireducens TaxID=1413210 RepID=A0A285IG08_9FIRM|nr:hypothetical protein [Orenia metallireducens]PRX18140.1 bacteriocin-like protein [Orenia metallireducens]SNY46930.1 bacteriocin-type signal sequence-containing protein [Orenia metallireducens]